MPTKGIDWKNGGDAQLFNCVLQVHDIKLNYKGLAEAMKARGYDTCTAVAITHRVQRIKTQPGDDAKPKPTTTKKEAAAAAAKSNGIGAKPAMKRKRKEMVASEEEERSEASEGGVKDEEDVKAGKKVKIEDEGDVERV